MIGQFRLLVFDWDGTLADSEAQIIAAMQMAIEEMDAAQRADDDIRNIIGLGLNESVAALCPQMDRDEQHVLAEKYRQHYLLLSVEKIPLFPGVRETLQYLLDQGYLLAVATGKSRRGLDRSLQETGLDEFFHTSRCADESISKPHPQMLQEIMDTLDVGPADALMIGDSEYDLQMAINADIASVAVSYGTQRIERLLQYKPLTCLHSLYELQNWLTNP